MTKSCLLFFFKYIPTDEKKLNGKIPSQSPHELFWAALVRKRDKDDDHSMSPQNRTSSSRRKFRRRSSSLTPVKETEPTPPSSPAPSSKPSSKENSAQSPLPNLGIESGRSRDGVSSVTAKF